MNTPSNRIWNVGMPVVALVEAPSAEVAIKRATQDLQRAGFEIYEGSIDEPNAFESEDQAADQDVTGQIPIRHDQD